MSIDIENIRKRFGNAEVLSDINLKIASGEMIALLGPSGSGKTTLLRILAGLETETSGRIRFGKSDVTQLTAAERRVGFVFQNYALFRHMTVAENVAFGLTVKPRSERLPKAEIEKRVAELLAMVQLSDKAGHYPAQLSGGQQQRVALARALVIEPSVLLFDEPLSNLDAKLRVSMRTEIRRIQQEVGITAIYVTHDQSEAMALSDQIIIMNKGVVAQIGTPQEIYYHPVSEFVADFIGEANFLRGKMTGTENGLAVLDVEGERLAVAPREGMRVGEEYTVVLRPESAALSDEGGLPCTVELSCFMGSYQNYHVRVGNTLVKLAENDPRNKRIYRVGEQCHLTFAPDTVHVL